MTNTDEELQMMKNPSRWPRWPFLPLKRRNRDTPGGFPELGRLLSTSTTDDTVEPVVYLGTLFETMQGARTIKYTDLEAIVDDDWRVD